MGPRPSGGHLPVVLADDRAAFPPQSTIPLPPIRTHRPQAKIGAAPPDFEVGPPVTQLNQRETGALNPQHTSLNKTYRWSLKKNHFPESNVQTASLCFKLMMGKMPTTDREGKRK